MPREPAVEGAAPTAELRDGPDPFLTSAGPWGPRAETRLLLWPQPPGIAPTEDNRLRMLLADLLGTDPATAGIWLRRGTPMRVLGGADAETLQRAHAGLEKLGLWAFYLRPADLQPALSFRTATAVTLMHGRPFLTDADGALLPLNPPVTAVRATFAPQAGDGGGTRKGPRNESDFASFIPERTYLDLYHAGGLVRLRAEELDFDAMPDLPPGLWRKLKALEDRLIPEGSRRDTGFDRVQTLERTLATGRVLPDVDSAIPVREWTLTEYGCAAYAGFRTGVLPPTP